MNFETYREFRARVLSEAASRDLLDLGETRHTRSLGAFRPAIDATTQTAKVHRCHLAEDWLALFGLPGSWKQHLFVSRGVRHSLSLILPELNRQGFKLHLPEDIYPVYFELARQAGFEATPTFTTLPYARLPSPATGEAPEALLLANPLKPLGRLLQSVELAELRSWLGADARRRLIIDAVYTFGTRLDASSLELFTSGQVIILHSLSKGWVAPQIFGVALAPEADAVWLKPIFQENSPTQAELYEGQQLLRHHSGVPDKVRAELDWKRETMMKLLVERGLDVPLPGPLAPGYLAATPLSAALLLERHNVLAIPTPVFGSRLSHWSILSTLGVTQSN